MAWTLQSLWTSEAERQEFLDRCVPPPLEGWQQPAVTDSVADPAFLVRQADAIESEYRQWLSDAAQCPQVIYFGRSL